MDFSVLTVYQLWGFGKAPIEKTNKVSLFYSAITAPKLHIGFLADWNRSSGQEASGTLSLFQIHRLFLAVFGTR